MILSRLNPCSSSSSVEVAEIALFPTLEEEGRSTSRSSSLVSLASECRASLTILNSGMPFSPEDSVEMWSTWVEKSDPAMVSSPLASSPPSSAVSGIGRMPSASASSCSRRISSSSSVGRSSGPPERSLPSPSKSRKSVEPKSLRMF